MEEKIEVSISLETGTGVCKRKKARLGLKETFAIDKCAVTLVGNMLLSAVIVGCALKPQWLRSLIMRPPDYESTLPERIRFQKKKKKGKK